MDFEKFDTRAASETPRPLHLRIPHTGELIYSDDGKPCHVLVRGAHARSVQAGILEEARVKLGKAKIEDDSDQLKSLESIQTMLVDGASKVIAGFENVNFSGKPATLDDVGRFLDLNFVSIKSLNAEDTPDGEWRGDSFAQQVLKFSNEMSHFLAETLSD